MSEFIIYTADGHTHSVQAPSLRTALRNFQPKDAGVGSRVIAAVESGCLPAPAAEDRPFFAVFLKNPRFTPPEEGK